MLRIIVLYQRNRILAIILYALFAATHVVAWTFVIREAIHIWRQHIHFAVIPSLTFESNPSLASLLCNIWRLFGW